MRPTVVLLVLASSLSGCLGGENEGPPSSPASPAPPQGDETIDGGPVGPGTNASDLPSPPTDLALHFSPDGRLAPADEVPAEPVQVPLESSEDAFVLFAGVGTWTAAPPSAPILISEVTIDLSFGHETGGVANPAFPPIGVFFGSSGSAVAFTFIDGPPSVASGEVHHVNAALPLPLGGLVVPAGSEFYATAIVGYAPHGPSAARNFVQVAGTDAGSRLQLTAQIIELSPGTESLVLDEQGEGEGAECFEVGNPTGNAIHDFSIDVGPDVIGLRVELTRVGGQGMQDLDLIVLDAADQQVAGGFTPAANEQVTLFAPNLDAASRGAWTVRVAICGAQAQASFAVQAWTSTATEPLMP